MKKENVYLVDDNTFSSVVKSSKNIHEALKTMGLNARGAAYKIFKKRCRILNIDISHLNNKTLRAMINDTKIIDACALNISRQSTLKELGLDPHTGSNVKWIEKKIRELNIITCHWIGIGHLKGKSHSWTKKIPLASILVENSEYSSNTYLKKRLLDERILVYICYNCGINEWMGKRLSLQLEHKNGINTDNRIENLELLCPNCHSLTETFAGKNIKK